MFFSDLYFPPKNSGKNIRSASGFFIAGIPFANFSLYVDLFQEISPRIAKQLRLDRSNYIILDGSAKTITLGFLRMEYLQ
jgi:hypothetical protein